MQFRKKRQNSNNIHNKTSVTYFKISITASLIKPSQISAIDVYLAYKVIYKLDWTDILIQNVS